MIKVVNMGKAPGFVKTEADTYMLQPRATAVLNGSSVVETNLKNLKVLEQNDKVIGRKAE